MLVSYEWLSEYVDLEGITPSQIIDALTCSGIEASIKREATSLSGILVGKIINVSKHPSADRLNLCTVDVGGDEHLEIVCGASNVSSGAKVPVATLGTTMPDGMQIKRAKLRGVESSGMICSQAELGLTGFDAEGIMLLEQTAQIGSPISDYFGLTDTVMELELTANRTDCLSLIGVAYEVAAIFDREITVPAATPSCIVDKVKKVEFTNKCLSYATQKISKVNIKPSPRWMQNRLAAMGIRPINNIVDVTNYVMLETGQPLHAFDFSKVSMGTIEVREAKASESIITLDGVERSCPEGAIVIADSFKLLAIAGIMGGLDSAVNEETTTVLLEAGIFDPVSVRRTSRQLGLRSESSSRFEKGINAEGLLYALERASTLLKELSSSSVSDAVRFFRMCETPAQNVSLRNKRLQNIMGVKLSDDEVIDIFRRLRFGITKSAGEIYLVEVPSRRADISLEIDLIEEVARLYGYNRIPSQMLSGTQPIGIYTKNQRIVREIRSTLRNLGMNETLTYTLTSHSTNVLTRYEKSDPIKLSLPMSSEYAVLRTTLLPSLLEVAVYNVRRVQSDLALFELSSLYLEQNSDNSFPKEVRELAGLVTHEEPTVWSAELPPVHPFYRLKGMLEALFKRLDVKLIRFRRCEKAAGWHPGRTAEIFLGDKSLGFVGELHPQLAKDYGLPLVAAFHLDLDAILASVTGKVNYRRISKYPKVTRDIALVVDKKIPVMDLEEGIYQAAGELLEKAALFDIYWGAQIDEEKKGIAYALSYRAYDRTLTDDEVDIANNKVIEYLREQFGATLRS